MDIQKAICSDSDIRNRQCLMLFCSSLPSSHLCAIERRTSPLSIGAA